ncbi:C40 family peptidase [Aestuariimicrobium ganziense]|uniref:C40 family peptidase n=1 Tax=Aestuariimicrobium ganziense TaxID=2773677 RepID=UPI001943DA7E|nr:C40 family peptidase [Aestuariimicrobium ganziense]
MTSLRTSVGNRVAGTAVAFLAAAGLVMQAAPAQAEPDTVKEAQKALEKLEQEHSVLDLQYAKLEDQLTKANKQVATLTKDLSAQESKVSSMKGVVARIALTQHQRGSLGQAAQLLASPDDASFMKQLATLESVSTRSQGLVQQYQVEQAKVNQTKADLVTKRNEIATAKQEQAKIISGHEAKEAEAKKLLDKLTKQEQERLARLQAEKAEAQRRAIAAREAAANSRSANRTSTTSPSRSSSSNSKTTTPPKKDEAPAPAPAGSRAQTAVNAALSRLGYQYVSGGTGPSVFDCSGLMVWSYRQAGISLPRTSQAQYGAGVRVSASQLQPGDLVFYYSGISHVGMYIGNGKIVHAANPRTDVNITSLYSMPFMGARRVG